MINVCQCFNYLSGFIMVPKRLKVARKYAGLSQEKLGVLSGLDEVSARARISKYEHGTNRPTYELTRQFAKVLNVPTCYFYIDDDGFANQVLALYDKINNPTMPPRTFY
ncbi:MULTISPECIES: helix-turn-helix domain-containing protein [Serratia]|uniref:helix-turn-helix domain-containing protein n=2 Tax=Gammaproteobacteria TaxID=1236 RepID=UPI0027E45B53|nr:MULTISPECIES: helix-turn-helix transcriptional regulator [Serratia]